MPVYRTPGVYIEEISTLPPSVAEVATAVPAFVGYTETGPADTAPPKVLRISTLLDYRSAFGGAQRARFSVTEPASAGLPPGVAAVPPANPFSLYYALAHYFKNGGGPCYVVSVGHYGNAPTQGRFSAGLAALEKEDEPTLLVLTDAAMLLPSASYYAVCGEALAQCRKLGDRFTILDVQGGAVQAFRNDANLAANLMYGAAYHPYLQTSMAAEYDEAAVEITRSNPARLAHVSGSLVLGTANGVNVSFSGTPGSNPGVAVNFGRKTTAASFTVAGGLLTIVDANSKTGNDLLAAWTAFKATGGAGGFDLQKLGDGSGLIAAADLPRAAITLPAAPGETLASIRNTETAFYNNVRALLEMQRVTLPPSAAMAGIYARVDRERGVWKAPANVGVLAVLGPVSKITDEEQEGLNIDATAGKSVNAIRAFTGKGTLVWGARTLAGNDNEWRYVSVRRLFIMIEESARKASAFAVFEPNDATTWLKVKAMIESYLYGLWERGALAGAKPESAYFVRVGLGSTMTAQDVLNGYLIVEIGIAAVRPAEFVVLRFSHKLQTE
ncbi:phage tail sheath family protein [Aquabacterium sp. OR-4]|uniref:phage tail sheath family protein n=1 Tax=Aquabacterium sp. OR-4 TaxID=2978127 RepID=UPI0028C9EC9F|nr:phage tail sheath C-terminal domain-containing protein [Aquabacterium sp. OR-4]MDT7836296.1 phage tail sheath C-terminal domain-containing protein [Aquabacterium sp. OR-4]